LPFVLPTVVVAAAFMALVGPRGLLNEWLMMAFDLDTPPIQLVRTLPLILIVHVFYNYSLALRMISSFWATQSIRMEEAARVLGARSEEHTSELQSRENLVCRLLLEKKKTRSALKRV